MSAAEVLTEQAFAILMADLRGHGNNPGQLQQEALMELVGTMTAYAFGTTSGRRAFGLATGCGKTSALVAWITAAHRLGLDHISVAVAASKVKALCIIKKELTEHGVPEALIGIKHSLGASATEPSTGNIDRRYQLVTHSRVRGGTDETLFTQHQGVDRAVMIYDESLFKSDTMAVSDLSIRKAAASFREEVRDRPDCTGLVAYLDGAVLMVGAALVQARELPEVQQVTLTLPELSPVQLEGFMAQLGSRAEYEPLRDLLRLAPHELRVIATQQQNGLIWYQLSIPHSLKNVMVLDASYPIRKLVQLDQSIICDSKYADKEIKRFDNVTVHQMLDHGGRHSVSESFSQQHATQRDISREVVAVVKEQATDIGILIFTFKNRPSDRVDILKVLKGDLLAAGIDLDARLPDGKTRLSFLGWGDETSLNEHSHCSTVIMAGVLHRSCIDLASAIVGQQDDLKAAVGNKLVAEMVASEIAHSVYQGLSRGACRRSDNGQARAMDLYLIHKPIDFRDSLRPVMPGYQWTLWEPKFSKGTRSNEVARMALRIADTLERLLPGTWSVSTRKLKEALGPIKAHRNTFTDALRFFADSSTMWNWEGRSLVRAGAEFYEMAS